MDRPGTGVAAVTDWHEENSEVLLLGSVAVAVMSWPTVTAAEKAAVKLTLPPSSVVTSLKPRNVSPSPFPDGSHAALAKSSTRKAVLGELSSVPPTVMVPEPVVADVNTGSSVGYSRRCRRLLSRWA